MADYLRLAATAPDPVEPQPHFSADAYSERENYENTNIYDLLQ